MSTYIQLFFATLFPIAVSAVLYILEKNTGFGRLEYKKRQAIIGIIFGLLAIWATEKGITLNGATLNVRDAAPLCAALIFGAPAGIIAGVIGGVERFFAAYWGAGAYTQIACSIATVMAGCLGAGLRKFMFEDKKAAWYYGLSTGIVVEVFHMLMVFLTNMNDARQAFTVVQRCASPMIILNALAVMVSILVVQLIGKEKLRLDKEETKISQAFQRWLLVCVAIAYFATSMFTVVLETKVTESQTESLLRLNIEDVKQDIEDASNENLLLLTDNVANDINAFPSMDNGYLQQLAAKYGVSEINIVNTDGYIEYSTEEAYIGFDMNSGEQSAAFLVLLDGSVQKYVQEYQPISIDSKNWRKYGAVNLGRGGFVQVGYDSTKFQKDIGDRVTQAARNRHVGEKGYLIIADEEHNILYTADQNYGSKKLNASNFSVKGDWQSLEQEHVFEAAVYEIDSFCMYGMTEGFEIIAVMPRTEADFSKDMTVYITIFMEILVFAVLFGFIYFLIKKMIVNNIRKVNDSLAQITGGNLDVRVDVRNNQEFSSLSDDINSTVVTLKRYIAEAAARIDKELEFARTIQVSSLPGVFPPFPNHKEFDIWASMDTAKEVGGDFYDFYFVNENQVAFLIADVSGKGIPAAMFMMTAKTMIKSYAESSIPVNEVFTETNAHLCENNDAGMFVTAWMGVLNIETGMVTFANAGHNPPLVRRNNGRFEYLKSRAGFVLAGMEGMRYRSNELQLEPGDQIYLYTDGVTEATDSAEQLYGEERLQKCMNQMAGFSVEAICKGVKSDVDAFVGDAPQFDDMTMLCLTYHGPMK